MPMTPDLPAVVHQILPTSLLRQQLIEAAVTIAAAALISVCALLFFRRVRLERPPIGRFNGRDIAILLTIIVALPFLYAALPEWALTCFLALTFASALHFGYRPVLGSTLVWLIIGLLIGANIWTSRTMEGSTTGWQLWWAELDVMVAAGAVAVANLYVQGGMKMRHVAWFSLGVAAYDVIFTGFLPLTSKLVQEFLGAPLDPSFGMRFGIDNFAIGIGDLLVYGLFVVAAYKAYGRQAARLAVGLVVVFGTLLPAFAPLLINFVDARHDVLVPNQAFFGPVVFVSYLWMKHHYGRERTMAEYRASAGPLPEPAAPTPSATAPEPAPALRQVT
jgi:hypothetical protein